MKSLNKVASTSTKAKPASFNRLAVACSAFMGGLLCISSVAEATDMQIYAAPSAGKKTIIMMLDTSGSMDHTSATADYSDCNYGWYEETQPYSASKVKYCTSGRNGGGNKRYGRIYRLQEGMFAFLNSSNPVLQSVRVGLGNYSANGDGQSGQILVPAKKLGAVGSTHREALKTAIKNLTASGGTPSAHAYAEAASYLMGTTTKVSIQYQAYFQQSSRSRYAVCLGWSSDGSCNGGWDGWYNGSVASTAISGENGWLGGERGTYYYQEISGFDKSSNSTKNSAKTLYESPLPAVADRVSCDGQGVYFLSDGVPNNSSDTKATTLMKAALGTFGANFNCTGGLSNTGNSSGWACMGEFAKKLYNKDTNPAGVSIQTAFVGFGADFTNLSASSDVQNACRLSSRTQVDRTSDDACSPTGASDYTVEHPGYGNGGFYTTQTPEGVTNSVIDFIDNLNKVPIDPLATGAVAVPVDSLDPSSFQEHGYLRALEPIPATPIMVWTGNLKKYSIVGGQLKYGSTSVFDTKGALNKNTKDNWNESASVDNGEVRKGGAYARLLMPTSTTFQTRPLFTDIASVSGGSVVKQTSGTLLSVPVRPVADNDAVLNAFATQATLKDFPLNLKLRLLNYLGYDLDLTSTTALPTTLTSPEAPFISMGGVCIHSQFN